jgi:hypothetical protein
MTSLNGRNGFGIALLLMLGWIGAGMDAFSHEGRPPWGTPGVGILRASFPKVAPIPGHGLEASDPFTRVCVPRQRDKDPFPHRMTSALGLNHLRDQGVIDTPPPKLEFEEGQLEWLDILFHELIPRSDILARQVDILQRSPCRIHVKILTSAGSKAVFAETDIRYDSATEAWLRMPIESAHSAGRWAHEFSHILEGLQGTHPASEIARGNKAFRSHASMNGTPAYESKAAQDIQRESDGKGSRSLQEF